MANMAIKENYSIYSMTNYENEINKSFMLVEEMRHEYEKYEKLLKLSEIDRVKTVKAYVDYMTFDIYIPMAKKWFEMLEDKNTKIDKRKKYPEKEMFDGLKEHIEKTFFNGKKIEIKGFCQGGFEGYYTQIEIACENINMYIEIPCIKKITVDNFEYANCGRLQVAKRTSSCSSTVLCSSYKEEDISNAIEKELNDNILVKMEMH